MADKRDISVVSGKETSKSNKPQQECLKSCITHITTVSSVKEKGIQQHSDTKLKLNNQERIPTPYKTRRIPKSYRDDLMADLMFQKTFNVQEKMADKRDISVVSGKETSNSNKSQQECSKLCISHITTTTSGKKEGFKQHSGTKLKSKYQERIPTPYKTRRLPKGYRY